ncbi:MAG: 23S rRNA (uracil(1939)-C(5))-methyltransferase RlmD [Ruminiclostridium sp.]|nr:23S rRNA (uracil(1939)-C(5))-methyltransferase RlmD [Ruminiclostridium sp.]
MKKNDIVEIEITALSSECSGIGKKDGMVIFVPFSAIGDKLEVKILKVNKTYCYGKIERIITPSPDRVTPDCPVYTKCGGCSLRHISYEAQLRAKEQFVKDAFTRIGGLSPEFLPIIRNTNINGYRNKLQIPIGTDKDGNLIAGFYAFHSHRIVPCEKCLLQPDIFSKITADFLKISTGLNLTAYDETMRKGILRHLYLRKGYYSGEICLCIVVAKNVPEIKILSDRLLEKYPEIVSSVINVNNRDTNVILGDEEIVLTSKNYICDIMCKNAVNIAPKAFYQVNTPCAEQLYSSACDFAEPKGKTVLDLYCGAGTIGLSMARTAKKIIGVEIVPEAIENAKQNALANGITNCEFICADAAEAARILHSRNLRPDVIMVDPPRKGCGRDACEQIAAFSAPRIVMVSCNAATAARDCAYFAELGYSTDKCVAVDMFSGTNHVETVVLLSHKKADSYIHIDVEFGEGEGKIPVDSIAKRAEAYKPKEKVTYKMIKEYIEAKYGFKVHTAYIAEVKRDLGLPMYDAPNAVEELKQPRKHPTPEKVEAIKDALRYFAVI